MKICVTCNGIKHTSDFYTNGSQRSRSSCKLCTRLKQKATSYGVTVEFLINLYQQQNGQCAVCKENYALLDLVVDHNQKCCPGYGRSRRCGKCIRGLLCSQCNSGIGLLRESVEALDSAAKYLLQFRDMLN
jgi:hypothetical protein